jgi:hypothetical protein
MSFHPSPEQIQQLTATGTFMFAITLIKNGYPALLRYAEKTWQFICKIRRDRVHRQSPREIDSRAARAIAKEVLALLKPAIGAERFPAKPGSRRSPSKKPKKHGKRARRSTLASPLRRFRVRSGRRSL